MLLFAVVRSLVRRPDEAESVLLPHPRASAFCIHIHPGAVGNHRELQRDYDYSAMY